MPSSEQSHKSSASGDLPRHLSIPLGLIPTHQGITPQSVETLRVLGHGRAAEARLVRAHLDRGQSLLCVEKVFRPALLTRFIYRAAFQAPFAYQSNGHAIQSCYYRRRVAGAIVEASGLRARVAEPLYVRWDAESEAFVLGSEFVQGRGIKPQAMDPYTMRRWLAGWIGKHDKYAPKPGEEIRELLELMSRLEQLFRQCGLEGSGWQVCKRAMVSTANLLRTSSGYVVVDLESGIPAVLVPTYVLGGMRLGAIPPFDDVDGPKLLRWVRTRRSRMISELGRGRYDLLREDVNLLIEHTEAWKRSEAAWGRNKWRVLGRSCRSGLKQQCLEHWQRRDIIDQETAAKIAPGSRIYSRLTFLLGLVPGAAGRFLQRLWANRPYRVAVQQFLGDAACRSRMIQDYVDRCARRWRESGRIPPAHQFKGLTARFLLNGLLALTPPGMHRWCSDADHRRNILVRMWLVCVSARFQSEYGRYLIRSWIRHWEEAGRITPLEAMQLRGQLNASGMDEYVRCFGMHMGLKLLLPLLTPLKFGGGAAFLASGNFWFLFFLFLMPACRTAITVWRMLCSKRPASDYIDALLVGVLPTIGTLAYPVQMYSRYKELSAFLMRDSAGRLGRWLPIYGGKDSRTEIGAIKLSNLAIECLEIGLAGTAPLRKKLSSVESQQATRDTIAFSTGRWNRLADEQLRLIAQSEAATVPLSELVARNSNRVSESGNGAEAA